MTDSFLLFAKNADKRGLIIYVLSLFYCKENVHPEEYPLFFFLF